MERNEISIYELKIYNHLRANPNSWFTHRDLASAVGFAERTVRAHVLRFVKLGIIDRVEVFPAYRYKLSSKAAKRNQAYVQKLERASEVFGLPETPVTTGKVDGRPIPLKC